MVGRMSGLVRGGLLLVGAVAMLALGGCNNDKEKLEALTAENTSLRQEKESTTQQLSQSEARRQQAENERDAAIARANQMQPMPLPPGSGPGVKEPKPQRSDTILSVAGDVAFGSGSATLTAAGKKELDGIAKTIKSKYSGNRIRIEGYTDSDPVTKSKFGSNEALSAARAAAVEKYLQSKGISGSRMESVGMGSAKPKKTKAASRRVEIVILG